MTDQVAHDWTTPDAHRVLMVGLFRFLNRSIVDRQGIGTLPWIRDMAQKGRHRGTARLTESDVRDIRARAASGERLTTIAPKFGISESAASLIVSRRRWPKVA